MKPHGKNPQQEVIVIIPARLDSTRLPNKLLLPLAGKPLILHTLEAAKRAKNISRVIVAADSAEIAKVVEKNGDEVVLTSQNHQSGSDRVAEVAETLPEDSIIVNVQGDEPLISPTIIERAVEAMLENDELEMATTCEPIDDIKDVLSPDVVKVICDENNFALYFSRAPIPFPRDAVKKFGSLERALREDENLIRTFRKHTGLYVYRREFLLKYTKLAQTNLEKTEMLEQLRALESGAKIKVVEVAEKSIGVDTAEDFERAKQILEAEQIIYREATIADIPQIARVHVESWQGSFKGIAPQTHLNKMSIEKRVEKFEKIFSQEKSFYKMFVAETPDKQIVGFADFGAPSNENPREAALYALYFLPEYQRRGIGGKIFRLCQKEMAANGFTSMSLDALAVSPYRAFYEKMGGRVIGKGRHDLGGVEFETVIYGWDNLKERL